MFLSHSFEFSLSLDDISSDPRVGSSPPDSFQWNKPFNTIGNSVLELLPGKLDIIVDDIKVEVQVINN